MAEKRMITRKVTDDDNFVNLSSSAQALYLHLSMNADDDGFCNQVSSCMFKAHASVQDLEALLEKRYLFQFENGVIVIKHWRMANALRKDRYTPTAFQEELAMLGVKDNGAYTLNKDGCRLVANWLPDGCQMVATDKNSIDKNSIDKSNKEKEYTRKRKAEFVPPTLEEIKAYIDEKQYQVDPQFFLDYFTEMNWVDSNGKPVKSWKGKIVTWDKLAEGGRKGNGKPVSGNAQTSAEKGKQFIIHYDNESFS